jgi:hypothetical protein
VWAIQRSGLCRIDVLQRSGWHFYCLSGKGRWRPGTRVLTNGFGLTPFTSSTHETFNDQV